MKKRAFSLIEISIVLVALSFIMAAFLPLLKSSNDLKNTKIQKSEMEAIKKSIEAYISIHTKLPLADSDGDGVGDVIGLGDLPYVDLQLDGYDKYGISYKYDVSDVLTSKQTYTKVCDKLKSIYYERDDINNSSYYPQIANDENVSQYVVAAVVLAIGENKSLSGINNEGNRTYSTNDDSILEITSEELLLKMCDIDMETYDTTPSVEIQFIGDDWIYYIKSDDNYSCKKLDGYRNIQVAVDETLTLYQSDDEYCDDTGNSRSEVYDDLITLDSSTMDYLINALQESGGGSAPKFEDNIIPDMELEAIGEVHYIISDNPTSCNNLSDGDSITLSSGLSITFYRSLDSSCNDNTTSNYKTYDNLIDIDINPEDYYLYVIEEENSNVAPTIVDNDIDTQNVKVKAYGAVRYISSTNPTKCKRLRDGKTFDVEFGDSITFYRSKDKKCADAGTSVAKTHTELIGIDINKDYEVNVYKEVNNQSPPTVTDN